MPYTPPPGWLEPVPGRNVLERATKMFHRRQDCVLISDGTALRPTDRPYDAMRCRSCGKVTSLHWVVLCDLRAKRGDFGLAREP